MLVYATIMGHIVDEAQLIDRTCLPVGRVMLQHDRRRVMLTATSRKAVTEALQSSRPARKIDPVPSAGRSPFNPATAFVT